MNRGKDFCRGFFVKLLFCYYPTVRILNLLYLSFLFLYFNTIYFCFFAQSAIFLFKTSNGRHP